VLRDKHSIMRIAGFKRIEEAVNKFVKQLLKESFAKVMKDRPSVMGVADNTEAGFSSKLEVYLASLGFE